MFNILVLSTYVNDVRLIEDELTVIACCPFKNTHFVLVFPGDWSKWY